MASILTQHEPLIREHQAAGKTLVQIVAALAAIGCKTTYQNVSAWLKRRDNQARLKYRKDKAQHNVVGKIEQHFGFDYDQRQPFVQSVHGQGTGGQAAFASALIEELREDKRQWQTMYKVEQAKAEALQARVSELMQQLADAKESASKKVSPIDSGSPPTLSTPAPRALANHDDDQGTTPHGLAKKAGGATGNQAEQLAGRTVLDLQNDTAAMSRPFQDLDLDALVKVAQAAKIDRDAAGFSARFKGAKTR